MCKKLAVYFFLLCFMYITAAFSHEKYFKSGILVGVHAGYHYGAGTFKTTFNDGGLLNPISSASRRVNNSAGLIGLIGGYRHVLATGYAVGVEIAANYIGMNELKTQFIQLDTPFNNSLKRRYNAIPSITFGVMLNKKCLLNFGLGLGISRFEMRVDNITAGVFVKDHQTKAGFAPSAGFEYATTPYFSLIAKATYELYPKVSKTFDDRIAPALAGSRYTASLKPRFLTLNAGFIFKF